MCEPKREVKDTSKVSGMITRKDGITINWNGEDWENQKLHFEYVI